jgi:hypothetical protein
VFFPDQTVCSCGDEEEAGEGVEEALCRGEAEVEEWTRVTLSIHVVLLFLFFYRMKDILLECLTLEKV